MNKYIGFILGFPFLILVSWFSYAIIFEKEAASVVLPVRGYDPRDLLSGHYIRYWIDWDKADCFQLDWQGVCPRKSFQNARRFYVPENQARSVEYYLNDNSRVEMIFAFKKGYRPVAKELWVDGKRVFYTK